MKRTFEIEWDDDLGPMWMNEKNLLNCLHGTEKCSPGLITAVCDVTPEPGSHIITIDEHGVIHAPTEEARTAVLAAIRYAAAQR